MRLFFLCILLCFFGQARSQSDFDHIYTYFQSQCVICHSNSSPDGGLDLEGTGVNARAQVYAELLSEQSSNSFSRSMGYQRVFAGDPYRSTLFRKMCRSLDDFVNLDISEGDHMPPSYDAEEEEKEFIRQWILSGAEFNSQAVDSTLISRYYQPGNGVEGIDFIPPAPAPNEGFQIKAGPFLVPEQGDVDLLYLYKLPIADTVEVVKIDVFLETYTHHFILYEDDPIEQYKMFTVSNETETIVLPKGTAFSWPPEQLMKINPHYFNHHADKVLAGMNYINVYTQPKGTAIQLMKTDLLHNTNISIPNDSVEHFFQHDYFWGSDTSRMYIWNLSCHTHQLGKSYRIYSRGPFGGAEEELYSGSHLNGDPMGLFIGFNWDHPPHREFAYPFVPIYRQNGFIHEASFINTSDTLVHFGSTAMDEMMAIIVMYLTDTTGLYAAQLDGISSDAAGSSLSYVYSGGEQQQVVALNPHNGAAKLELMNLNGQILHKDILPAGQRKTISLTHRGVVLYRLVYNEQVHTGKFILP